jgi:hypothetical protein|tara:strand:+ start:120 stop:332 length:213 start_codon:yes stop_codon:yes gene_type:complete
MTQENTDVKADVKVDIRTDDIQAVMQANPMMAVQVQNRALMRKWTEAQGQIARLTEELAQAQDSNNKKKV